MSGAQRRLAEFVACTPRSSIDDAARDIARQSLLDSVAVSYAGVAEPSVRVASDYVASMRHPAGVPGWLAGDRYLPEAAALLNAVSAHALDYDDVTPAWRGHPGAVMWPALLAVAEEGHATYGDLLDAYVLGFEAGAQVGANITAHHYAAGWHATATIGVIAGAAACCRALKLDAQRTSDAIGLAVSQAAGVQANFGSMAKPLQAGFASSAAVRSAALAKRGARASEDALEGSSGFSGLYGATTQLRLDLPAAGARASIVVRGIEVKQFPNCYAAHRAVEAALQMREQGAVDAGAIRHVLIEGTPAAHKPLLPGLPRTPDEARFSVEFGVACALLDGAVRLGSFTPAALERADIRALVSRTEKRETPELGAERAARLTLTRADGSRTTRTVANLQGRYGEKAFMRRLSGKVADCMAQAGIGDYAQMLCDDILAAPPESDPPRVRSPHEFPRRHDDA
jgi:2-methylcitrate dehydratase PrpD